MEARVAALENDLVSIKYEIAAMQIKNIEYQETLMAMLVKRFSKKQQTKEEASKGNGEKEKKLEMEKNEAKTGDDPTVEIEKEVEAGDAPAKAYCFQSPELVDMTTKEEIQESRPKFHLKSFVEVDGTIQAWESRSPNLLIKAAVGSVIPPPPPKPPDADLLMVANGVQMTQSPVASPPPPEPLDTGPSGIPSPPPLDPLESQPYPPAPPLEPSDLCCLLSWRWAAGLVDTVTDQPRSGVGAAGTAIAVIGDCSGLRLQSLVKVASAGFRNEDRKEKGAEMKMAKIGEFFDLRGQAQVINSDYDKKEARSHLKQDYGPMLRTKYLAQFLNVWKKFQEEWTMGLMDNLSNSNFLLELERQFNVTELNKMKVDTLDSHIELEEVPEHSKMFLAYNLLVPTQVSESKSHISHRGKFSAAPLSSILAISTLLGRVAAECAKCEAVVKEFPQFQDTIQRRGIEDVGLLMVVGLCAGYHSETDDPSQHFNGTLIYIEGSFWDGFAGGKGNFTYGPYEIQNPEDFFKDSFYKYGLNPEVGYVEMPIVANQYGFYLKDLDDCCLKAQLANYIQIQYRALLEEWTSHMWAKYTGVLIWKTLNPWTGLRGQFYDHLPDQTAGFYACQCVATAETGDDILELIRSLEDLDTPEFNPIILKKIVTLAMDRKTSEKDMASELLYALNIENFPAEDIVNGFVMLLGMAEDTTLDIKDASNELALLLAQVMTVEVLAPLNLEEINSMLPPKCSGSEVVQVPRSLVAGSSSSQQWDPGGKGLVFNNYYTRKVFGINSVTQFLIQWKGEAMEKVTWREEVNVKSQFSKLRLEDKSVFQEAGNVRTANVERGPNELLVQQRPKPSEWRVYVRRNRKGHNGNTHMFESER